MKRTLNLNSSWGLFAVLILIPGATIFLMSGIYGDMVAPANPPGQRFYLTSKFFGLFALYLLVSQIVLGLIQSKLLGHNYREKRKNHIRLALMTLAAIVFHIAAFFIAVDQRSGHIPWGALVPKWGVQYYQQNLSYGAIALFSLLAVIAFGFVRSAKQSAYAKMLHKVWLVVFVLAMLHSIGIGTETREPFVIALYFLSGVFVMLALLSRVYKAKRAGQSMSPKRH